MRVAAIVFLSVLVILMGVQIFTFYRAERRLSADFSSVMEEANKTKEDYEKLQADYQYYQNPANLEKELRARFNLKYPDEKMMVIVPKSTSSEPSSTQ
ncbi:MAG: hypothetical protein V1489_01370 [Candidatus Liptonbacteria bacterium]